MLPATTALMILKTHDDDIERVHGRRSRLQKQQRRFQHHSRLRTLLA